VFSALKIGDVDAFFIGSAIMSNRETARLLLDENDITGHRFFCCCIHARFCGVYDADLLNVLVDHLTDIGCRAIAKGLTGHKSIKEVDFRRDAAGEKAFEVCARSRRRRDCGASNVWFCDDQGLADMLQAHSQSVEELLCVASAAAAAAAAAGPSPRRV
jgi:hypothetical protein